MNYRNQIEEHEHDAGIGRAFDCADELDTRVAMRDRAMADRTIYEIARDALADCKVIVPVEVIESHGPNLAMAAFDWTCAVDEAVRAKKLVPQPFPWLLEHLSDAQRELNWWHFCDLPKPQIKQREMF